jgi:hypothetical protein
VDPGPWEVADDDGPCMDYGSLAYGRGSPVQRRTCVPLKCHWRSPCTPATGSSRNSHVSFVKI